MSIAADPAANALRALIARFTVDRDDMLMALQEAKQDISDMRDRLEAARTAGSNPGEAAGGCQGGCADLAAALVEVREELRQTKARVSDLEAQLVDALMRTTAAHK